MRDQIYEYALVCEDGVDVYAARRLDSKCVVPTVKSLALLLTCRAVYTEAVPILYGRNEFIFSEERALARFTNATGDNVKHIRKVRITRVSHKAELHRIKVALKPAHMLTILDLKMWSLDRITANEMADLLGPLFRVLHASQKKYAERKSRDVTDILRISARYFGCLWEEKVRRLRAYDALLKELITKTLK